MFCKSNASRELRKIAKELVSASKAEYSEDGKKWEPCDSKVADKDGYYRNFTGTIDWKGTKGKVKNADFHLDDCVHVYAGTWLNGTWKGGEFYGDAVWKNGTWERGFFSGKAVWKNGTWEGGYFYGNAIWEKGTWKNGHFDDNAVWKDGTWENGLFFGNAVWKDGAWKDGIFYQNATWEKGTWERGRFLFDAIWESGDWKGGEDDNNQFHGEGDSPDHW